MLRLIVGVRRRPDETWVEYTQREQFGAAKSSLRSTDRRIGAISSTNVNSR